MLAYFSLVSNFTPTRWASWTITVSNKAVEKLSTVIHISIAPPFFASPACNWKQLPSYVSIYRMKKLSRFLPTFGLVYAVSQTRHGLCFSTKKNMTRKKTVISSTYPPVFWRLPLWKRWWGRRIYHPGMMMMMMTCRWEPRPSSIIIIVIIPWTANWLIIPLRPCFVASSSSGSENVSRMDSVLINRPRVDDGVTCVNTSGGDGWRRRATTATAGSGAILRAITRRRRRS